MKIRMANGSFVSVDDDDYEILYRLKWRTLRGYASHGTRVNGKCVNFYMHRMITNCPDGMYVDHINGDISDNRKENLRICTNAQNTKSKKLGASNTTGYKGVTFQKSSGNYVAQIFSDGKRFHIGSFKNAIDAHMAYCEKAKELHGEYARFQ